MTLEHLYPVLSLFVKLAALTVAIITLIILL